MTTAPTPGDDTRPGFLASLGGFLRPGRHTAREGAAGSTASVGVVAAALVVAAVVVWRRRSR